MNIALITLSTLLCLISFTLCSVIQFPPDLIKNIEDTADIKCAHTMRGYDRILWYKHSQTTGFKLMGYIFTVSIKKEPEFEHDIELSGDGRNNGSLSISSLTINDSAVYFCAAYYSPTGGASGSREAYFGGGTRLTVLDPLVNITKPTVKILKPSENEECEKTRVTLVCLATGFYPDHVQMSWRINGMKQMNGVATDNAASYSNKTGEMPFYTISSRLSITHQEWHDGLHYKCVVSFYNGKETSIHSDSINGPQGPKVKYLKTSRLTMLAYGAFIGKSVVYGLFILFIIKRQGLMCK